MIRNLKRISGDRRDSREQPRQPVRRPVGGGYAPQYGGMGLNEDDFYDADLSEEELGGMMDYGHMGMHNRGQMDFEDEFGVFSL